MKVSVRRGSRIDPTVRRVVKFWPNDPPRRGGVVLVDDVRCRVTRCKVSRDGPRWTIRDLRVEVIR